MTPTNVIENYVQMECRYSCGHSRDFYLEVCPKIGDVLYCPQCKSEITVMERLRIRWMVHCRDCNAAIIKRPMLTRPTVVKMGETHADHYGHTIVLSRRVDSA